MDPVHIGNWLRGRWQKDAPVSPWNKQDPAHRRGLPSFQGTVLFGRTLQTSQSKLAPSGAFCFCFIQLWDLKAEEVWCKHTAYLVTTLLLELYPPQNSFSSTSRTPECAWARSQRAAHHPPCRIRVLHANGQPKYFKAGFKKTDVSSVATPPWKFLLICSSPIQPFRNLIKICVMRVILLQIGGL